MCVCAYIFLDMHTCIHPNSSWGTIFGPLKYTIQTPNLRRYLRSRDMDYILLMAKILPQLRSSLSHYLQGSIHPRWCRISSINSMSSLFHINLFQLLQHPFLLSKSLLTPSLSFGNCIKRGYFYIWQRSWSLPLIWGIKQYTFMILLT